MTTQNLFSRRLMIRFVSILTGLAFLNPSAKVLACLQSYGLLVKDDGFLLSGLSQLDEFLDKKYGAGYWKFDNEHAIEISQQDPAYSGRVVIKSLLDRRKLPGTCESVDHYVKFRVSNVYDKFAFQLVSQFKFSDHFPVDGAQSMALVHTKPVSSLVCVTCTTNDSTLVLFRESDIIFENGIVFCGGIALDH